MNVLLSLLVLVTVVLLITALFGWLWSLDDAFTTARDARPPEPSVGAPVPG